MGICLDTEAKPLYRNGVAVMSSKTSSTKVHNGVVKIEAKGQQQKSSPGQGKSPHDTFDTPRVPVIFVIGGPGSGKITHSEVLSRRQKGFLHVNMTEMLQQVIDGTELNDIGLIPTSKVTDVVMKSLRKKAKIHGYIVSGYPRNMRDVSDYIEKIGRCDGVILINWHQMSLERQIEYGARLGEIELDTARLELKNFRKYVIPVAEYFDYKQLLYVVGGERKPEAIFKEFCSAFDQILDSEVKLMRPRPQSSGSYRNYRNNVVSSSDEDDDDEEEEDKDEEQGGIKGHPVRVAQPILKNGRGRGNPFVIWVIGGPGSCKTEKIEELIHLHPTWHIISVGRALWEYLDERYPDGMDEGSKYYSDEIQEGEEITSNLVKGIMRKGEMVPQGIILDIVLEEMYDYDDMEGFFITGFPRDIVQALGFEERTGTKPNCILIDCSELELGRSLGKRHGRIDDNMDAYKRRLELYRELTLPMLKAFDEQNRLKIVDGDSDGGQVNKELRRCIHKEINALRRERALEDMNEHGKKEREEYQGYQPVDMVPENLTSATAENDDQTGEEKSDEAFEIKPNNENENEANDNLAAGTKKKVVRYHGDINPEVEAELQKVIEELQEHQRGKEQTVL